MALATELPIYRAAYDLLIQITQLTGNFPRNRRLLAQQMFEEAHRIVQCVFRANSTRDKVPWIEQIRERLGSLQLSLRLSTDLRLISPRQFGSTVELAMTVSKQSAGWLKFAQGRT